jgi:hypothetical protein
MAFDIDTYTSLAGRVDLGGLDFGAFREQPLDEGSLRCLRYMHDVEHHTICYLRDLLVTRAHRDPEMTAFLTMWTFEEYWHGDAIAHVLQAHGEPAGVERIEATRRSLRFRDRVEPLLHGLGSAVAGVSFGAIHMTWGAVNEWTTQAAYSRLSTLADHPVLTELLRRIMRQEGRHIDFYSMQASRRLASSKRARQVTRAALKRWWRPVGSDLMPPSEVRYMAVHLFGGPDGGAMCDRIDRRIDRLPGLSDLHLAVRAAASLAA